MEAVFEVKSLRQQWKPPFKKEAEAKEVCVPVNAMFEKFDGTNENIFKLVKAGNGEASIWYSEQFTLKGHSHPRDRIVELKQGESASFTYLWGENGITKTVKFKKIV